MKKSVLKSYAELIVKVGAAVKRGQSVVIRLEPEVEEFAAIVAKECYKAGAKRVVYEWRSAALNSVDLKYAKKEVLGELTPMGYAFQKYQTDELPVLIWLDSDDPDGMKGVDMKKLAYIKAKNYEACAELIEARENRHQWCIAGVPGAKWAKKVFPHLSKKQAIEALWKAILKTARADYGDPIKNWEEHDEDLKKRCEYLNSLHLKKLHYTSENGTDLTVGLIPGVIFLGGGEHTFQGTFFQPNIPTEECFTSPMRGEAEGIVHASKPLAYNGNLIENFWFRFHEGKVVECHAEKGEEALKSILTLDEGASYLGECALVPFNSPINQTGLLFYSTLYDENACCHLAIGRGFTMLYPNFTDYTEEELHSFGINKSLSHVDFMIGTEDLKIVGIDESGKETVLFLNGTWAF